MTWYLPIATLDPLTPTGEACGVMHIRDILKQRQPCFSFEFFPPRTREGAEQLYSAMVDLAPLGPSYVSVTYGAGGSTRELTHGLILRIHEHTRLTVVSH